MVNENLSLNSTDDIKDVIQQMCPDSQIAKNLKIGKTKTKYVIEYGIHPYLQSLLNDMLDSSAIKAMVILFDESLNREQGKKQLDYHVRFWHDNRIHTRYLDSEFLGKATHTDLFECFKRLDENTNLPCLEHLIQVSMDGPHVNHKALNKVENDLIQFKYGHGLLDIGTCGLHTMHNGFKISTQAKNKKNPNSWQVGAFLQSLYTLFKDCPARVEEYQTETGAHSDEMPKAFSSTRWLENVAPANRAIEMLPHLRVYIAAAEDSKNKRVTEPKNQSFKVVKEFVEDVLAKAKLGCFIHFASKFGSFLKKYQTDRPMAPYLLEDRVSF